MSDHITHSLHTQNIVACIWDFDKTLIPGYMQAPLFKHYNIDVKAFWKEVNMLPELYGKRGCHVSKDTVYLNHILSFVRNGPMRGLNNQKLFELGSELEFYPGLPTFFQDLRSAIEAKPEYAKHDIRLEHYIISTGLAQMIKGSKIAPYVDGIFGCEFIEDPFPPYFSRQKEFELDHFPKEISQIGVMVDNTIKTRFAFEINKGTNKNPIIDVNAKMRHEDRRIPIYNMIYIADGPSDVPVFSVIKHQGGKTFAVYDPDNEEEFAQNDELLQTQRIHGYGPADYRPTTSTSQWITRHLSKICDRIVKEREVALQNRVNEPPKHIHKKELLPEETDSPHSSHQQSLF